MLKLRTYIKKQNNRSGGQAVSRVQSLLRGKNMTPTLYKIPPRILPDYRPQRVGFSGAAVGVY